MISRRWTIAAATAIVLIAGSVNAHELHADCRLAGMELRVSVTFTGNIPAGEARVRVLNSRRQTVSNGRTNESGMWIGPLPQPGEYQVIADAGAGHLVTVNLTVPESENADDAKQSPRAGFKEEDGTLPWSRVLWGLLIIAGIGLLLRVVTRSKSSA